MYNLNVVADVNYIYTLGKYNTLRLIDKTVSYTQEFFIKHGKKGVEYLSELFTQSTKPMNVVEFFEGVDTAERNETLNPSAYGDLNGELLLYDFQIDLDAYTDITAFVGFGRKSYNEDVSIALTYQGANLEGEVQSVEIDLDKYDFTTLEVIEDVDLPHEWDLVLHNTTEQSISTMIQEPTDVMIWTPVDEAVEGEVIYPDYIFNDYELELRVPEYRLIDSLERPISILTYTDGEAVPVLKQEHDTINVGTRIMKRN